MSDSNITLSERDDYVRHIAPQVATPKTAKDITELRKQGQLSEAYDLATELLAVEPDNVWTKRAMGWVRYERLKALAKSKASDDFIQEWTALSTLVATNSASETMLTNQAIWQAVSHMFAVSDTNQVNNVLDIVFASIQQWSLERPSDLYSALLRAILKAGKTWASLGAFLTWWGLSNLRSEDYLPGLTNEGKKMMSLAEQAYIAYAKQVLDSRDQTVIRALIADLEILHEQHPEYQYPPYYQAKLLVATGSKEQAMTALLPFARRKQGEFWLWDLLAELYEDEPEKAVACLCRAVNSQFAQEKFLVNARVNLARKLHDIGKHDQALTELTKAIKARQTEGWNIAANLIAEKEELLSTGAAALPDNKALYRQYRVLTDELLYVDIPEQIGVVTSLNTDKKVANFMVSQTVSAHFKYESSMSKIKPGDFVAVRLEQRQGNDGAYWVPLSLKPTEQLPSPEIVKSFSGVLSRHENKAFGFVNDIFIPPTLAANVTIGSTLSGLAVWSYDKQKNRNSWKAIQLIVNPF
ncbi:hypothetical protein JYG30_06245 [Fibrella sp. USSR17]